MLGGRAIEFTMMSVKERIIYGDLETSLFGIDSSKDG